MSEPVYKVMTRTDWETFDRSGDYPGSPADQRDGFVHLAAADQLPGVVERHFAGQAGLMLIALDPTKFGVEMKWEEAHDTAFPHLYAPLPREAVFGVQPIPDEPDARRLMLALSCT